LSKIFIPLGRSVGSRLREARNRKNFTQIEAAGFIRASSNAPISRWERGIDEPQIGAIIKLAQAYEVSLDWLLTGQEPPRLTADNPELRVIPQGKRYRPIANAVEQGQYAFVPLLKDAVAAGPPRKIQENDIEGYALIYADRNWMPGRPENYSCVYVRGKSMYPILNDGDIVAIDHRAWSKKIADLKRLSGQMCAFRVNGGVTIKWLKFIEEDGVAVGVPENKDELDHVVVLQGDEINQGIVGLVRWWWCKR